MRGVASPVTGGGLKNMKNSSLCNPKSWIEIMLKFVAKRGRGHLKTRKWSFLDFLRSGTRVITKRVVFVQNVGYKAGQLLKNRARGIR